MAGGMAPVSGRARYFYSQEQLAACWWWCPTTTFYRFACVLILERHAGRWPMVEPPLGAMESEGSHWHRKTGRRPVRTSSSAACSPCLCPQEVQRASFRVAGLLVAARNAEKSGVQAASWGLRIRGLLAGVGSARLSLPPMTAKKGAAGCG
jgi:hypothetical protein